MNDLLPLLALLLFGPPVVAAYLLVPAALFPRRVARSQVALEAAPGRALVVGAINVLFFGTLTVAFFSLNESVGGLLALPGTIVFVLLAVIVTLGLASLAQLVGQRLVPTRGPLGRGITGGIVLALGCGLPVLGWFVLLPALMAGGVGGFVLSYLYGGERAEAVPASNGARVEGERLMPDA